MRPSIAPLLVGAVLLATLAGLPGLVHRRAWPVSLLFLPLAGYLLVRVQWSALATGPGGEVGSFLGALRTGGRAYMRQHFPLDTVRVPELKLLVSLVFTERSGSRLRGAQLARALRRSASSSSWSFRADRR